LVEQSPNAEINLDAAFAPIDSVSMGEGLMEEDDGEDGVDVQAGAELVEAADAVEIDAFSDSSEKEVEETGLPPPAQLH
ncbi:MAG: hypothetical protein ACO273_11690, partial [Burkholderiales bacterium]